VGVEFVTKTVLEEGPLMKNGNEIETALACRLVM
jgi:hypothetical protein